MNIKNVIALPFLIISFLLTLWLWAFLEQIPGVPNPIAGGVGTGGVSVFFITFLRWLALSIAFLVLLIKGELHAWAPYPILRFLLVMAGIFVLEICMFPICLRTVDKSIAPHFHWLFSSLVILLPLAVMVGGYLGSRAVFIIVIAGSLAAAFWPIPTYIPPPPDTTTVDYMLHHVNPEEDAKAILERLEKHPRWVNQVSRELDGNWSWNAAFLLSLKPTALNEDVQEKCWRQALSQFASARQIHDRGENWMPPEFRMIAPIVAGLVSIPSSVRDRHHAEFVAVRNLVNFYRNETSETRHPELPDLNKVDWLPTGK